MIVVVVPHALRGAEDGHVVHLTILPIEVTGNGQIAAQSPGPYDLIGGAVVIVVVVPLALRGAEEGHVVHLTIPVEVTGDGQVVHRGLGSAHAHEGR